MRFFNIETFLPGDENSLDINDYVEKVNDERNLIERFCEIISEEDPDIIYGYNSDSFDFRIIRERSEKNKIKLKLSRDGKGINFKRRTRSSSARIGGRVHIDVFNFVSRVIPTQLQTEVLSLGEVSKEILNEDRLGMEETRKWHETGNMAELAKHSLDKSELSFRLGNFFLPQIMEISRLIGQTPFDVSRMMYSQIVEYYLSKRAVLSKRIIPNQPKYGEIARRKRRRPYVGGFVKEPVGGIHNRIAVLDFRSLYPTVIATHNISPETLERGNKSDGYVVPGEGTWFSRKPEGFVSSMIRELIETRKEMKKKTGEYNALREKALKIAANAVYGYFAYPGSKWYCFECARASAAWGRFYVKDIIRKAEKDGFDVIYSDTDSVFLKSDDVEEKTIKFLKKINRTLPGIIELELQGFYKKGLFVSTSSGRGAKKKYALMNEEGHLTIRGFETVRRDWCGLARDVQRNVLKYVLEDKKKESVEYVKKIIENIKKDKIEMKEFVIHEQITKETEEYGQMSPHVSAAMKMEKNGIQVEPGDTIMFVITSGSGSISQRAEPFELSNSLKIDKDYYIKNQIIPAAMRVLSSLGVGEEQLTGGGKQTGLGKFGV